MKYTIRTLLAFVGLVAIIVFTMGNSDCDSAADQERRQTNTTMEQMLIAQPVPRFDYSTERDAAIQLYEARNKNVSTWTVVRSDTGIVEFDCPSIAYPIPYDTSLTNPLVRETGPVVIEQAEPNGLYSSKNSIATWVRCVYDGAVTPVYVESKVTTYPFPVFVDYEKNLVSPQPGAKPSVVIKSE